MLQKLTILFLPFLLIGCGYTIQSSKRPPFLEKEGIKTVYLAPITNNTYKPGIENVVYNEMLKRLSSNRRIKVVQNSGQADAVLSGIVDAAYYSPGANTVASQLYPNDKLPNFVMGSPDVLVATEYSASLSCGFSLNRSQPQPGKKQFLWSDSIGKGKSFPATNQLGAFGTTSSLINESEFDRALRDLAEQIAADMSESMLAGF